MGKTIPTVWHIKHLTLEIVDKQVGQIKLLLISTNKFPVSICLDREIDRKSLAQQGNIVVQHLKICHIA